MEMEDHRRHQYSMPDLRQLLNGKPIHFQEFPQDTELFSPGHWNPPPPLQPHQLHPFDMMQMVGMQVGSIANNNNTTNDPMAVIATVTSAASTLSPSCRFDGDSATAFGGDGGTGRWPRQETLTLLETRSRLDSKFKEANQKGPLWDEVSRIMLEEHGYQRSGKKCREKFENLYKYYKKTKEGKAGRQDGKHYRFFRQLEALYGDTCNNNGVSGQETHLVGTSSQFHGSQANQEIYHSQKLCDSLSLSSSTKFDTCSSDNNELSTAKKRGSSKRWKAKIKEFIDSQDGMLMERQEAWLVKLTKMLEKNEEERVLREEQWRKEEASRIDREHKFWAKERARIKARDAALMEALHNLKALQSKAAAATSSDGENHNEKADGWQETEVCKLIQLRTAMEARFQQGGLPEVVVLWEEIGAKMGCLGFERSGLMCKDKWDALGHAYSLMINNKTRKENSRGYCDYYQHNESVYQGPETLRQQANDGSSHAVNDSCFRFFTPDGDNNLWENYGLKLSN